MAEGDGSQNQGQQQQSGRPQEVKPDVLDQRKLERAEKERERRRRRRRKKAELKRLERETLLKDGNVSQSPPVPGAVTVPKRGSADAPKEPEVPKEPPVLQADKVPAEPVAPVSKRPVRPREPRKKPDMEPVKKSERPGNAKVNVRRLQKVIGGGDETHPLIHKTHSFAGPLITPAEVTNGEKSEPGIMPVAETAPPEILEPTPQPVSENSPGVALESVSEPQILQEPAPEVQVVPEPRPEYKPELESKPEPQVLPVREEQIQPRHDAELVAEMKPEPVPEPVPEPEPETEVTSPDQHEPQIQNVTDYRSGRQPDDHPSVQSEDLIIHNGQEEVRPRVEMREVHNDEVQPELPPVIPSPKYEDINKSGTDDVAEAEEIVPVNKPSKPVENEKKNHERHESEKETVPESEGLGQRKSFLQSAGAFSAGVIKNVGQAFHSFRLKFDFRKLLVFVVLMVVGGGLYAGYLFKLHEKAYDYVSGFFKAPPAVEVNVDEQLLKEWGITTALLFGDNRGSTGDLFASQLFNSYYFGFLNEPKLEGETGITPAYFYGTAQDIVVQTNTFIGYVKNLRELVSSYDVDVYKMLDQTTNRDDALKKHLAKLKEIMDASNKIIAELKIEIDDLKVSYDSLSPDKARFESDFFVALQGLAGEKSDFLLKSFIDVSQKQTAIKGRYAALQKLAEYYDSSIQKLAIRITSIEKNYQALVQGIRVVDIPGANLDIIIKETP